MKKKGQEHYHAEQGNLVGYQSMTLWSTTPKVLLTENRVVHSRNIQYDVHDYGLTREEPADWGQPAAGLHDRTSRMTMPTGRSQLGERVQAKNIPSPIQEGDLLPN